jgi:cytochrome P450
MLEHEYLDQIFYETLRLHPILGMYSRECTEEITFDNNGRSFKVEKGMSLMCQCGAFIVIQVN